MRKVVVQVVLGCFLLFLGAVIWLAMPVIRFLSEGEKTILVLLQNDDELRATGGFLGSHAWVKTDGWQIKEVRIEDIYDLDGKLNAFIGAPVGVIEYLSDGNGWRLPDSNWSSDFPTAVEEIWGMIRLVSSTETVFNLNEPDLYIAINTDLMEKVIDVLGGIQLVDYGGVIVTSENFAELARAERDNFFPGSRQKVNFLKHFYHQLELRLKDLRFLEVIKIAKLLEKERVSKTWQVVANDNYSDLRKLFSWLRVDGALRTDQLLARQTFYLNFVESNVGINKINALLKKEVKLEVMKENKDKNLAKIQVDWHVDNEKPNPLIKNEDEYYSNYQRLIVSPTTNIESLYFQGQRIENWDEELRVLANGVQVKEIGFLISFWLVEENGKVANLEIILSDQEKLQIDEIYWDRQAGAKENVIRH